MNVPNAVLRLKPTDHSMLIRLQLWHASIETIQNMPVFGYDITNRFTALTPYLPVNFTSKYSHPHNDILASIIGAGFIGGLFAICSLLSPIWAAIMSENGKDTKVFLAVLIVLNIIFTANINTVFFNDITSAWLAFSTFLIWNLKLENKGKKSEVKIKEIQR